MFYSKSIIFIPLLILAFLLSACGQKANNFDSLQIMIEKGVLTETESNLLKEKLSKTFLFPVHISTTEGVLPQEAFVPERNQYDVQKLLDDDNLFKGESPSGYTIIVTSKDIFEGKYNFLFGQTNFEKKRTYLSFARLGISANMVNGKVEKDTDIKVKRFYKLILRRIGAMAGLTEQRCVMTFSNSLDELDRLTDSYCPEDAKTLRDAGILK